MCQVSSVSNKKALIQPTAHRLSRLHISIEHSDLFIHKMDFKIVVFSYISIIFCSWRYRFYCQLGVYADDANVLGGSVHTIRKNTEALVIASKEIGLEANADNIKHTTMSRDQNAGQNTSIMIDNKSSKRVKQSKYLRTTLTNTNSIHDKIKSSLKSGNACYHSVENLLSYSL